MRSISWIFIVPITLMAGCLASAWQDVAEHFTDTATTAVSTTAASSPSETTPTTSQNADPVQTVTGPPAEATTTEVAETTSTTGTTSPPEENEPPKVMLTMEPTKLTQAGPALLLLDLSADVVKVRVSKNGTQLAELTPADFPYLAFEALSAKDNTVEPHVFTVEVEDEEGLTATGDAELTVELPARGVEKCVYVDETAVSGSEIVALTYTETAIVAGGWRDAGDGRKATIWKLDPNTCTPVPGWYRTIASWTEPTSEFDELESVVTAVAVDEHGKIAVGGNLLKNGGEPWRYTALLAESGARVWERQGAPGEEVSSVAFAPGDLVISGGWKFTSNNPPRTDAVFWTHVYDNTVVKSVIPWTLKTPFPGDPHPDPDNWRSEWIRAMTIDPDGYLLVLGEREYLAEDFNIYTRAFLARLVPLGGQVGSTVTSPGDAYKHEAMYSLSVCGSEIIAGGWTLDPDAQNAVPQPLFRWISNGIWLDKKLPELMPSTELHGAACDREGKVLGAGMRKSGGLDARVFAFEDPLGERTWYETGSTGDDEAHGVVCDTSGFCAWPGYRTLNGKKIAIVRVHHP